MQAESIRELCSKIAAENNSEKLVDLIARLRALLAEKKIESEDLVGGKPNFKVGPNNN